MQPGKDKKNARIAMIAVVLFIVFDFAALALNYWLSFKIEQQAIAINLAGRQRMLSQRMAKVLLQIESSRSPITTGELLKELALTFNLFDNTLQGFHVGHKTRGGNNEELFLPAARGPEARATVEDAVTLWAPCRKNILQVLTAGPNPPRSVLNPAIEYAEKSNLPLLGLMNRLTTELELQTKTETRQIRIYQGSAFALALANFFWVFLVYRRRIHEFSHSHNLLDEIINKISASVLVLNEEDAVLKANHKAELMFGYDSDEILGKQFNQLVIKNHENDMVGHRADGTSFMALVERSAAMLNQRELYIITVLDITQQRKTEKHLSSLAYHDLLTRLPNRLLFDERLRLEIVHAQRRQQMLAVLFIDLDKFKPVNDTYGHEIGDLLLKDVAVRLRSCLRESDTVSRRGGDEFTIIATDIDNPGSCEKIAQMVLEQLRLPFSIQNLELSIGCSIGISIFPTDGNDAHLLIGRADIAMYQAKQKGRGSYCFYSNTPH